VVDGAALEKRCAKAPRVRIPPSPPQPGAHGVAVRRLGPRWAGACSALRVPVPFSVERSPSGLWRRTGNAVRGNPSRVRIPPSPPPTRATMTPMPALTPPLRAHAPSGALASAPRSRTVGCARPGARTSPWPRRPRWALGFSDDAVTAVRPGRFTWGGHMRPRGPLSGPESPISALLGPRGVHELQNLGSTSSASSNVHVGRESAGAAGRVQGKVAIRLSEAVPSQPSAVDSPRRARRGTSGALYLQSAPAGLNSHPRSPYSRAAASSDVEDRVPRSGDSRTVSGPEGSSTKRTSSGAAERPGPSRSSWWARDHVGRRWVHGNF
jgi:hypothetical protein